MKSKFLPTILYVTSLLCASQASLASEITVKFKHGTAFLGRTCIMHQMPLEGESWRECSSIMTVGSSYTFENVNSKSCVCLQYGGVWLPGLAPKSDFFIVNDEGNTTITTWGTIYDPQFTVEGDARYLRRSTPRTNSCGDPHFNCEI